MILGPLSKMDALNLAFEISPKILEKLRKDDYEKAICYKLAKSLGGNPLAIKLIFTALEHSLTRPLWEVIMSIWTEGYPGQIYGDSPTLKRHFDYFLSQAEDEPSKMMLTLLSPFKESVPKDLSIYFDCLTALEVLPGRLLGFAESSSLAEAESSQNLKIFEEMLNSLIVKLEEAGFIIDEIKDKKDPGYSEIPEQLERPRLWTLHPLLPYLLSPKVTNFSAFNTERVIKAHADSYMARAEEWKSGSLISTIDLEHGYLNFISSFWRLRNPDGISIGAPAPWYLVNLLDGYDLGDEARKPEMVMAVALCEKTLSRFQKSSGDWERSLKADLIYHPTGVFSKAKMKIKEHNKANCPCWPLIALIVMAWRVESYNPAMTIGERSSRIHMQMLDFWKLLEKHFDDDFHYEIICGAGGNALLVVGMSYLDSFLLLEALEFLTRAQKLLQDSLVTNPMFQDQLEVCRNQIAKTEMLIANHGSRDAAIVGLQDDELAKIMDKMWEPGPETGGPTYLSNKASKLLSDRYPISSCK